MVEATRTWEARKRGGRGVYTRYTRYTVSYERGRGQATGKRRESEVAFLDPEGKGHVFWGPPNLYFLLEESTGILHCGKSTKIEGNGFRTTNVYLEMLSCETEDTVTCGMDVWMQWTVMGVCFSEETAGMASSLLFN